MASLTDACKAAIDAELIKCETELQGILWFGSEVGSENDYELQYVNTLIELRESGPADYGLDHMKPGLAERLNEIGAHIRPRRRFELSEIASELWHSGHRQWWKK